MATQRKKEPDSGMVGRLAERGEDAVTKLIDELGRSPRVTDALGRAMAAKGKLDSSARAALGTVGLAAADEIKDLRAQVERLERRLAKLEGSSGTATTAKKSETKKAPTARKRTTKASSAKKTASPAPGRSIGGGTGRGSSSGGGAAA
jgi:polyhydroxyalkanoate synthesis regulator phasin